MATISNEGVIQTARDQNVGAHATTAAFAKLPKERQAFVRGLRTAFLTAEAMRSGLYERKNILVKERSELAFQHSHAERDASREPTLKPEHKRRVAELKADLDAKIQEIADLEAEIARVPMPYLPAPVDHWLAE